MHRTIRATVCLALLAAALCLHIADAAAVSSRTKHAGDTDLRNMRALARLRRSSPGLDMAKPSVLLQLSETLAAKQKTRETPFDEPQGSLTPVDNAGGTPEAVMPNPLTAASVGAGTGIVKFPFVMDGRFNAFANVSPYNTLLNSVVIEIPGTVPAGHPKMGVGVFPPGHIPPGEPTRAPDDRMPQSQSQSAFLELSSTMSSKLKAKAAAKAGAKTQVQTQIQATATVAVSQAAGNAPDPPMEGSVPVEQAPATTSYFLPTAPYADPFTGEEDPILNFNPWNPYANKGQWTRRNIPPGQARTYSGPITAVPPGYPNSVGIPVLGPPRA